MPVDGAADRFFSPTEHGDLMFGVQNPAELAADAGYHAWTFTLTGTATVKLEIKPHVTNLDTVMYLYKNQETGSWGNVIMFYQHNQSPIAEFTCLEAGEKELEWYSEWCISNMLRSYSPVGEKTAPESGTIKIASAKGTLPNAVTAAMYHYRDGEGLTDEIEVSYTYLSWPGGDDATIYDIDLSSEGKSDMDYIIGVSEWDSHLFVTESGAGKDFPCKSIDTDLE